MIDQIITKQINIDVNLLWPYLSLAERKYLIGNFMSKDMNRDLSTLYDMMSNEEKMMVYPKERTITYVKKINEKEKEN